jgi:hypothetical protein
MKRILPAVLAALFLLCAITPALTAAAAPDWYTFDYAEWGISFGQTNASSVNVRRTARTNGQVVAVLRSPGTPLLIVGAEITADVLWYAIVVEGDQAYVRADLVDPIDAELYILKAGRSDLAEELTRQSTLVYVVYSASAYAYHARLGCPSLSRSSGITAIPLSEAKADGRTPCGKCNPPK